MDRQDIPFNIDLLPITPPMLRGVGQVVALASLEGNSKEFHPKGMFSTEIFGRVGDELRSQRYGFIDIKIAVFHPLVYQSLVKLKSLYAGIMAGSDYAIFDKGIKDFVRTSPMDGETGFTFFLKHWKEIDFGSESTKGSRGLHIRFVNKTKDNAMTSSILVMPAGLREMEFDEFGRIQEDEVNQIYRRILSFSNTITMAGVVNNPTILDASRSQLQNAFVTLYETIENLVKGKKKFLMGKWATRRVFNGTRNVITAMDTSVAFLGAPGNVDFNSTVIGLYQYMKATLPKSTYDIRQAIAPYIFDAGRPASLVDKKTLTRIDVQLSSKSYNQWLTNDGVESIISAFEEESIRSRPLMIEGHYLALIYKGEDGTFKIFQDIRELPEGFNKDLVSPITVSEFLTIATWYSSTRIPILVTRYPITGIGSIYPSRVHLRVMTKFSARRPLTDQWEPTDDSLVIYEFPEGGAYIDSQIPHSSRLVALGADFDGDTASGNAVISEEAIAEIDDLLNSPQAYIGPDGKYIDSCATSTINLVMFNMTGDPSDTV